MISICLCPSCKQTARKLKTIGKKLDRIYGAMENKENLSKLQLEQMLLAVTLFENQFYGLHRSTKVITKDEHDGILFKFDDLRQKLYDNIASFEYFSGNRNFF